MILNLGFRLYTLFCTLSYYILAGGSKKLCRLASTAFYQFYNGKF